VRDAWSRAIFTACLGFASVRGFVRGEREQIAIDNELRTAREIQRSLLPSMMPEARERLSNPATAAPTPPLSNTKSSPPFTAGAAPTPTT
jgi:hypothetical protein